MKQCTVENSSAAYFWFNIDHYFPKSRNVFDMEKVSTWITVCLHWSPVLLLNNRLLFYFVPYSTSCYLLHYVLDVYCWRINLRLPRNSFRKYKIKDTPNTVNIFIRRSGSHHHAKLRQSKLIKCNCIRSVHCVVDCLGMRHKSVHDSFLTIVLFCSICHVYCELMKVSK